MLAGDNAVLSDCGTYRWRLDRHVGAGGTVAALFGVNPATADASLNDPTVRKWLGFGRRLGWSRFIVGNQFGFRATKVTALARAADPFGPDNGRHLGEIIAEADVLVPCWGSRTKLPKALRPRLDDLAADLLAAGKPVMCWGLTASGDPRHPLMLGYDTPLVRFPPRTGEA